MMDIFLREDVIALLKKKRVIFMGDSNIRAIYKDLLCLLSDSKLIDTRVLRRKMEPSVYGDTLISHGKRSNYREYREEREGTIQHTCLQFYFLTQVYSNYVRMLLDTMERKGKPDVIVLNSLLWDITRWGVTGVEDYKQNLRSLMRHLKHLFPNILVIWLTAPPISKQIKGGFLLQGLEFLQHAMRFHVMEGNHYASRVVVQHGFDVLDGHYHLKMQIHRRTGDGVHWTPEAVRYVTNLLLAHLSIAWNVKLPHRIESSNFEMNSVYSKNEESSDDSEEEARLESFKKEMNLGSNKDENSKEVKSPDSFDMKINLGFKKDENSKPVQEDKRNKKRRKRRTHRRK